MTQETLNMVLLFSPLVIGGIISASNAEEVNATTEKAEAWIRRTQTKAAVKNGWFGRYIANPILWLIVRFSDWTDDFTHRGLKNGIRVAATLYLFALWCYILFVAFMFVVVLAVCAFILYIIFKVLINSNDDVKQGYEKGRNVFSANNQKDSTDFAGLSGKKIYSGTNWFNEELKGRVDEEIGRAHV